MAILSRARGAWRAFAFLFVLGAISSAPAQSPPNWTVINASNCWAAWNSYFLYTNSNGDEWFGKAGRGDNAIPGLWQEFEMLQVVEDAHDYAAKYYPTPNLQSYVNEINLVCAGIAGHFPKQWNHITINDTAPNDDLEWGGCGLHPRL